MRKILAFAFLAISVSSQAVVLDSFSDGDINDTITGGSNASHTAATVPGGVRKAYHDDFDGNAFGLASNVTVTNGVYSQSAQSGVNPWALIGYGYDTSGNLADLNADLSAFNAFVVTVVFNDISADLRFTVTSSTYGSSTSSIYNIGIVPLNTPVDVVVAFSDFSFAMDDIDQIDMIIDGVTSNDIVIDEFQAVPEPASMVLLAAGIGAVIARRRKQS